ncbi:AfsR/SARP family transcriptional regulator [Actinophytocola algeriensis]|uniref:DNA-binding SARP family transcriptional activator n=1 Tax=Actinophytocola algeriensis TaxID=1768010 RepID=A0A7W7QFW0_9PSEU|nr:AfsR/SARP family transcriptional regulator [Actinophytocola algeriensis]MBB4912887.1 DNA-binding SARP family transcriptional activator [Actinophytocola algeriensis]MBE1474084.1 DNA-binding SARP family transcriptional activator [Actinophytocola algeriensis]
MVPVAPSGSGVEVGAGLSFGVLGPLEVFHDGHGIDIGAGKLRAFLAALLVRANQPVSMDELAVCLWGEHVPRGARGTLQVHALRLRRLLGDDRDPKVLRTRSDGYSIDVAPDQLDLLRFRQLRAEARSAQRGGDLNAEATLLRRAIELWRGRSLSDIPSDSLQREVVPQLEEDKLLVLERRLDIDLEIGRWRDVVSELVQLTKDHPWHERFWEQLIIALHRSERVADALDTYRTVQRRFRVELGVELSERLHRLHQDILAGAGTLGTGSAPADQPVHTEPKRSPALCQLPPAIQGFVGRREVADLVVRACATNDTTVPILTVSGMPGAGKTALTVHAAHRLRTQYPDGQLYLDLKGFSTAPPLSPADALERFLRSLGVPPDRIPADVEGRAALYRAELTGRRVLVVLDNAASPGQVRPLLPGAPGTAVLVTSRMDLRGLTVTHGAHHILLDVLTTDQSVELLADLVGAKRGAAEPGELAALAELCGHLPLALRIAGANLAADPHGRVAEHVHNLRERSRLAELAIEGDDLASVSAVLDLSYRRLTPPDQQLLRTLGDSPAPEFTVPTAASLSELAPGEARRALDRLTAASLLQQPAAGRYRLHELVREYARDQAHQPIR